MFESQLRGRDCSQLSDSEIRPWGGVPVETPEFQLLTSKDPIPTPHVTEGCRGGDVENNSRYEFDNIIINNNNT